ncbi:toxin-antitoxin system YwqK family antitoxin [Saccharicrinis sp. 156]|uniref:toxin-antitoxin system YwqK family antitoxin n=1 Tax=Saccharicrinis sp. 156 TaxID=3417574 RepID=UPI003D34D8E5
MRILMTLLLFMGLVTFGQAQLILSEEDGLYYNQNGELYTGTYVELYPSGNKRVEMKVVEGNKQGISTYYFDNKLTQGIRSYDKNKMDGLWETWNEEGVKLGVASYKKGVKHGEWKIFDENGTLRYDMLYVKGKKSGVWKIYDEKGKLTSKKEF